MLIETIRNSNYYLLPYKQLMYITQWSIYERAISHNIRLKYHRPTSIHKMLISWLSEPQNCSLICDHWPGKLFQSFLSSYERHNQGNKSGHDCFLTQLGAATMNKEWPLDHVVCSAESLGAWQLDEQRTASLFSVPFSLIFHLIHNSS